MLHRFEDDGAVVAVVLQRAVNIYCDVTCKRTGVVYIIFKDKHHSIKQIEEYLHNETQPSLPTINTMIINRRQIHILL